MTDAAATPPAKPDGGGKKPLWANFGVQVLLGMAAGLVLGLIARNAGADSALAEALRVSGDLFVQLLRALVPPMVFTAIVASIANLKELSNAARLVVQTLIWFMITALIAVGVGMALGLLFQPGLHTTVTEAAARVPASSGSWIDFLRGLFPANMLGLEARTREADGVFTTSLSFNVLQIVVISIVVGVAALRLGEKAEAFLAFNRAALLVVRKILWWVIRLTPIGAAGLLGNAIARYGWETLSSLGAFAGAIYLGLAIVLFVVYPAILMAHGLNPLRYFAGAWPAIQLGFLSRSSIGTLPVTQSVTEHNLGVPRAYAAFAVPLGATTKMDGCAAIYPAIAAIFVAQFYGIELGLQEYVLIAFVSVIGSAATAGLTGAIVMLTLTLSTLGLPLQGAGLLLAIDPILDMGRTAVNVAGQALVPTIVAKREGVLDQARYDSVHGIDSFDPDREPLPAKAAE
ncbi:MAG: dicarboxylate/amino acid:cation symporter [Maricaulaceae bacterium]|nr:dicarboxylate/amino acid:cation symporter [Maricaulaceae bacterium]